VASARILAVDDDRHQLAALRRILRRSGFEVVTAENGRTGLRLAMRYPPDLVLLDVSMPTMSGHEFLRRFRRLEARGLIRSVDPSGICRGCEIPVIFLTALGAPPQRVSGLDAGAADYITKPFDAEELRARIRCQLRRARRQRETLAATRSQLLWLKDVIGLMRLAVQNSAEPLKEVETYLDLTESVLGSGLRRNLLARAKEDLRRLAESLESMAEWAEAVTAKQEDAQQVPQEPRDVGDCDRIAPMNEAVR